MAYVEMLCQATTAYHLVNNVFLGINLPALKGNLTGSFFKIRPHLWDLCGDTL